MCVKAVSYTHLLSLDDLLDFMKVNFDKQNNDFNKRFDDNDIKFDVQNNKFKELNKRFDK